MFSAPHDDGWSNREVGEADVVRAVFNDMPLLLSVWRGRSIGWWP